MMDPNPKSSNTKAMQIFREWERQKGERQGREERDHEREREEERCLQ